MRSRRAALKVLGAITASLLAAAPLASAIHLLAEPHEVCADHGELVHGDHAQGSSEGDATSAYHAEASSDSHEHDHCLIGAPAAGASLRPSRVVAATTPVVVLAGTCPQADPDFVSDSLYRIAPKNSPPA